MGIIFGKPLTPSEPPAPPSASVASVASVASAADAADPAPSAQAGMAQTGTGQLQGLQISVPSASIRPEPADPTSLPEAVQSAAQSAQLQPAAARQAAVPLAEQPEPAINLSPLCVPLPGSLATNPAVLDALRGHALAAGTNVSRELIRNYVALGERVIRAIEQPATAGVQRLAVTTPQGAVELGPHLDVARGISWYVVACAAQQDLNQHATGVSRMIDGKPVADLSINGSYVFKDPGHAIYYFMQSSPLAYPRVSTHFNEISASPVSASGKADQRGIEDYERQLPGENGTILFDRLKGGSGQEWTFVKFESHGMPHIATSEDRVDEMGKGNAPQYVALLRVLSHAASFVLTRWAGTPTGMERKEHVYKGVLKPLVHDAFMRVVSMAEKLGLLEPEIPSWQHARLSQERGFPHLETSLTQLKTRINGLTERTKEHDALSAELVQLEASMQQVKAQLGMQSDPLGIVRRGAETHVDLSPPRAHWQEQQRSFQHLEGDLAQAQGVLTPYLLSSGGYTIPAGVHAATAQDWRLHGIEINGKAYPGEGQAGWTASGVDGSGSSLVQACSAFVQACGGNLVAADWISRFARQRLAEPLLSYLQKESLGSVGEGIDLSAGVRTLKVNTLAQGAVEVVLDFKYENQEEAPIDVRRMPGDTTLEMDEKARLQASVALRFENLASFTAAQAPVPVISQPLTYSTSDFHGKAGTGFVWVAGSDSDSESEYASIPDSESDSEFFDAR